MKIKAGGVRKLESERKRNKEEIRWIEKSGKRERERERERERG